MLRLFEATLFTGWIYDTLLPLAASLKVGHPARMRARIYHRSSLDEARKVLGLWLAKWRALPAAVRLVDDSVGETWSFFAPPPSHRKSLRLDLKNSLFLVLAHRIKFHFSFNLCHF